jgi:hypothetical protein
VTVTDSLTRVEITGTSPGTEALRIAGRPLPFTAATLELDAAHWPVLTVSLPVVDGLVVTLDTRLRLAEETHAALVAMGWTPPATS